jgi:FAD/FMN-containing dehydrogenase
MVSLSGSALETLRSGFGGEVILPGDAGYDEGRSLWNGDIDRRPAVIAVASSADDVAAAIRLARDHDLEIAVRGGGHSFAGHGAGDDGVMINLGRMRVVTVNPAAHRVRCGPGTTWADLDAATQPHAQAVPGGQISHTGVAGLSLGGGIGWLTNKAGLSCDNLVSARVVTADGRIVTASATEHPELHWALRGGGGNFGVVTEFEFSTHDVGPLVNLGLFFWSVDEGADALRFIRDFVSRAPDDVAAQLIGLNAPPAPFVPERFHFAPCYGLAVVGFGSPEEHAALVQPIRDDYPPLFDFVTPIPFTDLQQMLDEAAPWGILAYEKALYIEDPVTDDALAVVADFLPRKASPMSIMPVFPLNGAYTRVGVDDTAFGGPRVPMWVFNISAIAPDPDLLATDRAWVRSFWEALLPYASSVGGYVNFQNDVDEERVRESYGAAKYDRLARVKAEYDPDNLFHKNANIKPAVAV